MGERLFYKTVHIAGKDDTACLVSALIPRRNENTANETIIYADHRSKRSVDNGFKGFKESGRKGLVMGASHHLVDGVHAPLKGVPPNFPASVPR